MCVCGISAPLVCSVELYLHAHNHAVRQGGRQDTTLHAHSSDMTCNMCDESSSMSIVWHMSNVDVVCGWWKVEDGLMEGGKEGGSDRGLSTLNSDRYINSFSSSH